MIMKILSNNNISVPCVVCVCKQSLFTHYFFRMLEYPLFINTNIGLNDLKFDKLSLWEKVFEQNYNDMYYGMYIQYSQIIDFFNNFDMLFSKYENEILNFLLTNGLIIKESKYNKNKYKSINKNGFGFIIINKLKNINKKLLYCAFKHEYSHFLFMHSKKYHNAVLSTYKNLIKVNVYKQKINSALIKQGLKPTPNEWAAVRIGENRLKIYDKYLSTKQIELITFLRKLYHSYSSFPTFKIQFLSSTLTSTTKQK